MLESQIRLHRGRISKTSATYELHTQMGNCRSVPPDWNKTNDTALEEFVPDQPWKQHRRLSRWDE